MMLIKQELLNDASFNKKEAINIAEKACSSKQNFDELMTCFLSNEYRVAQRAAWCVSHAVAINQSLIYPFIKSLVDQLLRTDIHAAVVRNSARILNQISIPEEHHGAVMNACFALSENVQTPIAIKAFALQMLHKLFLFYPEIKHELEAVAEACLHSESAAVNNVSQKIIATLQKTKSPGKRHKPYKIK